MNPTVRRPVRLRARFGLLVTAVIAAACSSTPPASPDPTDPREIVARALQNTAALRTVRIALIVEVRQVGGPAKTTVDARGDVDLVSRELSLSATLGIFNGQPDTTADVVVDEGLIYNRSNGREWSVSGRRGQDPLEGAPTTAQLAAAIEAAIKDPATSVTLLDPVAECGQAGCHRVQATIPRAALWKAFRPMLEALGGTQPAAPPEFIPDVTVDAWVEKGTLRLMQGTNSATVFSSYVELSFVLSRHDEPVAITPPNVAPPQPLATPAPDAPATAAPAPPAPSPGG